MNEDKKNGFDGSESVFERVIATLLALTVGPLVLFRETMAEMKKEDSLGNSLVVYFFAAPFSSILFALKIWGRVIDADEVSMVEIFVCAVTYWGSVVAGLLLLLSLLL